MTFLIAVAGAVFGGISFFSAQDIKVSVTPRFTDSQRGGTYQLGLVNSSARAVNIVGGQVLVDGRVMADVDKIVPFVSDNFDLRTDAELDAQAKELPYSVAGGASIAGTVMFTSRHGLSDENDPSLNQRISLLNGEAMDGTPVNPGRRVTLRLKFEPGGEKTTVVRFSSNGRAGQFKDVDHLPGWHSWINLDAHGRTIMEAGGDRNGPELATLRLWKGTGAGKPLVSKTQPLIRGWTVFALPR